MKTNKERIYDFLKLHVSKNEGSGVTTKYLADALGLLRTNVSSLLNELAAEGLVTKSNGRPVLYKIKSQEESEEDQCFSNLIGINGSMRHAIQVAKAALIYPEKSLNTLIIGEPGTGKSFLAMMMHQYAIAKKVIPPSSPFIAIDCKEYQGNDAKFLEDFFGVVSEDGIFSEMHQSVLHIENAQLLSSGLRIKFCSQLEKFQHDDGKPLVKVSPIVIVACDKSNKMACDDFAKMLPIKIELPALAERPLEERLDLIQSFFTLESARAKKPFTINAELLRCLLLYECSLNIKQLKGDIKRGCAMAYFRESGLKNDNLNLFLSDFEPYVRKGILFFHENQQEIERIIPANYNYTFCESSMQMSAVDREKLKATSYYDEIDRRASVLLDHGMSEEEIGVILSAEFYSVIRQHWQDVSLQVVNKDQLKKLVDDRTIDLVDSFLDTASKKLRTMFPPSIFYGLCLHIDSISKGNASRQILNNSQMAEIAEKHKKEYSLALQFTLDIERTFTVKLPVEEAFLITMFLVMDSPVEETGKNPVILYACLGDGVAASLSETINQVVLQNNVFAFEIPFELEPVEIYKSLRDYIKKIDRGKGIVVLYDLEFLDNYLETIELETGIKIRSFFMPITSVGIEWARKAALANNVDTLYQIIVNNQNVYKKPLERVIVTLCTTGMGGAQELKRYIEQYGDIQEMKVIPLAIYDWGQLRSQLQDLQKEAVIYCIVGTRDPKMFGIPFFPINEILNGDPESLPEILRFKNREKERINYGEIYKYLDEQLEFVNNKKLRRYLPVVIEQINTEISRMSLDTEIGLLMHIACCINRLAGNKPIPQNLHREQIITSNSESYKKLIKVLKPVERAFKIIFTDDEIANMITIIKQL